MQLTSETPKPTMSGVVMLPVGGWDAGRGREQEAIPKTPLIIAATTGWRRVRIRDPSIASSLLRFFAWAPPFATRELVSNLEKGGKERPGSGGSASVSHGTDGHAYTRTPPFDSGPGQMAIGIIFLECAPQSSGWIGAAYTRNEGCRDGNEVACIARIYGLRENGSRKSIYWTRKQDGKSDQVADACTWEDRGAGAARAGAAYLTISLDLWSWITGNGFPELNVLNCRCEDTSPSPIEEIRTRGNSKSFPVDAHNRGYEERLGGGGKYQDRQGSEFVEFRAFRGSANTARHIRYLKRWLRALKGYDKPPEGSRAGRILADFAGPECGDEERPGGGRSASHPILYSPLYKHTPPFDSGLVMCRTDKQFSFRIPRAKSEFEAGNVRIDRRLGVRGEDLRGHSGPKIHDLSAESLRQAARMSMSGVPTSVTFRTHLERSVEYGVVPNDAGINQELG
ncbi:hypothetical protein B0H17DRAFT_1133261 [Mycena rosella]|uniref:Uncharacterized protein n=1 Tax=Mycena rosella TaxID=1033263 RepID=A0AAD7DKE1_MYCRO|nr:hypothetical protein B0H17DRAFT_1133261 [Mycena rosella]